MIIGPPTPYIPEIIVISKLNISQACISDYLVQMMYYWSGIKADSIVF
jgi:hypothetical protein